MTQVPSAYHEQKHVFFGDLKDCLESAFQEFQSFQIHVANHSKIWLESHPLMKWQILGMVLYFGLLVIVYYMVA